MLASVLEHVLGRRHVVVSLKGEPQHRLRKYSPYSKGRGEQMLLSFRNFRSFGTLVFCLSELQLYLGHFRFDFSC